jgi:hypothetical protein
LKLRLQIAALFLLTTALACATCFAAQTSNAGAWQGFLVNSKCYVSELQDVNPTYTLGSIGRDMDLILKLCVPTAKTKSFGLVQRDWTMIPFGPDGDVKAAQFVRTTGKRQVYVVDVTGTMDKKALKVNAIALKPTSDQHTTN